MRSRQRQNTGPDTSCGTPALTTGARRTSSRIGPTDVLSSTISPPASASLVRALTIGLLDYFDSWKPADPLLKRSSSSERPSCERLLRRWSRSSLLQQSGRPPNKAETMMEQWAEWNPAAGFLHFSTKDQPFEAGEAHAIEFLSRRLASRPIPPATKTYPRRQSVALPKEPRRRPAVAGPARSPHLAAIRASAALVHALSTLMWLTFGSQKLMDLGAAGRAMLRTSPSAGARHPLEAYVVVRNVDGVAPGIYHYAPVDHRLVRSSAEPVPRLSGTCLVRRGTGRRRSWCSSRRCLRGPPGSTRRRAPYRDVLLEAGHFCQTFCLIATGLGLAPFCTAAMADSLIERDLGIDGVTESVIYACGTGTRPRNTRWAPGPTPAEDPVLIP